MNGLKLAKLTKTRVDTVPRQDIVYFLRSVECLTTDFATVSIDGNSLSGVDKRSLGYPTPQELPIPVKTAETTSKVFKWPWSLDLSSL